LFSNKIGIKTNDYRKEVKALLYRYTHSTTNTIVSVKNVPIKKYEYFIIIKYIHMIINNKNNLLSLFFGLYFSIFFLKILAYKKKLKNTKIRATIEGY
jgi:hypothetical protein